MYGMGTRSEWPKGGSSYCCEQGACGGTARPEGAGEGAAGGLGVSQLMGWGPKEPAGTCVPPKDDGDCEVKEEEEDCCAASLLHIWSIPEFRAQA